MDTFIEPLLFGLGPGAIVAALALGLVVAYRASGVINFGHGAVATYITYIYISLRDDGRYPIPPIPNPFALIGSAFGTDLFDLPTFIGSGGQGWGFWPAAAIALLSAVGLGLIMHYAVFRPLRYAPTLAKVVASVGIMLMLQAAVVLRFGSRAKQAPQVFPADPIEVLGVRIGQDRFWLLGTVLAVTTVLWAVSQFTRFGVATRAAAENERFATLLGFNADFQAGVSWVVAAVLAGMFGILVSPITGVTPNFFTLLVITSLGAALLGSMSSFWIAALAGIGLGMADQFLFRIELDWSWVPDIGIRRALPFLVIAAAMMLRGETMPSRGAVIAERLPDAFAPELTNWRKVLYGGFVALCLCIILFAPFEFRAGMQNSMVGVILALSLVVVTGYVGQISLMQMALAGVSAFAVASFGTEAGLPLPIALPLAVLAAVAFGLVAAMPSLRTRGASLAIVTLAFGLAIDEIFFERPGWFGLARTNKTSDAPSFLGVDFGPSSSFFLGDDKIPTPGFGVFVFALAVLCAVGVMRLRRSRLGQQMLAVRVNERAAAAAGINVAMVKLAAFGIAASLAGLGGALTAFKLGTYGAESFGIFSSLNVLAFAYLGGIATIGGAVTAGTLFAEGIGIVVSNEWVFDVGPYTAYSAGFFLIATAVYNNEGVDGFQRHQFHTIVNRVRRRRGLGPLDEKALSNG